MLILAELEGLHPMRLQLFGFPDPLYGHLGDSQVFCQTARGPMRPALWLHLHSGMDDALPHLGGYHPLAAALATSIAQPLGGAFGNRLLCSSWLSHRRLRSRRRIPLCCGFGSLVPGFRFGHAPPPQGRGLAINVQLPADLAVAMPLTGQQDNPSPLRQLLGGVSSPRQRLQSSTHCVVDEYCQCHGLSEHTSRKMSSFDCGFTLVLAGSVTALAADANDRLSCWRDAHFGMFIHWGLYAIPAGEWKGKQVNGIGEWIMNRAKIPMAEYEQLAGVFNPAKFNAGEWARLAEAAGQKYIVITAKHHDGFSMFRTKVSKYN